MWKDALLLFNVVAVIIDVDVDVELLQFPLLSNVNVKNFTRKNNIQKPNETMDDDGWYLVYWKQNSIAN